MGLLPAEITIHLLAKSPQMCEINNRLTIWNLIRLIYYGIFKIHDNLCSDGIDPEVSLCCG